MGTAENCEEEKERNDENRVDDAVN